MKKVLFLLSILTVASCADSVEFPSTYEYSSSSFDDYFAFVIENGEFVEVDASTVPQPSLSLIASTASISKIEFIDDTQANITDGFNTEGVTYGGSQARIWFDKDGQRVELEGSVEGTTFEVRSIGSGDFDGVSQNIYISALCGELVDCFSVNPSNWLGNSSSFPEGKVQYVVLRRDILTKR